MQEPICPVGIFHLVNLLYYWRSIKRAGSLLGRETDRPLFLIDRRRHRTSPKKSLRNRIISSQYWEFVSNLLSKADFVQYQPPSMVVHLKVGHLFFGPVGPNIIHSASPFVGSYLKTPLYDFLSPKLGLLSFPSTFFFFPFQHLFHLAVFSIYNSERNEKKLQKNVAKYEYGLIVGIWHMAQIGGEFKGIAWSKGCCTRELVTEEYSELPLPPFAGQGINFRFRDGVKYNFF